jgi:hypothetical protein
MDTRLGRGLPLSAKLAFLDRLQKSKNTFVGASAHRRVGGMHEKHKFPDRFLFRKMRTLSKRILKKKTW